MSFLFKINAMQQQKTRNILMIMNFIQGGCGWFMFIACIIIGNIKQQYKNLYGSIIPSIQKIYNPILALFSIIGIYQTLLGIFIGLILLNKIQILNNMLNNNKKLWLNIIHYGLIILFSFIFFICLLASLQSTIYSSINQSIIIEYQKMNNNDNRYKYYQSIVAYSRYLIALAILQFIICLPIGLINLYAIHTKHMNYQGLQQNQQKLNVQIQPSISLGSPSIKSNQIHTISLGNNIDNKGINQIGYQSTRPLQTQMIPK